MNDIRRTIEKKSFKAAGWGRLLVLNTRLMGCLKVTANTADTDVCMHRGSWPPAYILEPVLSFL